MRAKDKNRKKSVVAKKIRRRKIFFLMSAVTLLAVVCLFTPAFGVSEISVTGNKILDSAAVINASGIKKGDNVFRINTSEVQKKVCSLGYMDKAEIIRKFPSKIVIDVTECTEAAYILFAGNYVGIDLNCKVLSVSKSSDIKADKPIVSGIALKEFEKGSVIKCSDESKADILKNLFSAAAEHKLLSDIIKINLSSTDSIKFVLNTDTDVIFGNSEKMDYKMAYLTEVLDNLDNNIRGGTIDLSDTKNVIYKGGN